MFHGWAQCRGAAAESIKAQWDMTGTVNWSSAVSSQSCQWTRWEFFLQNSEMNTILTGILPSVYHELLTHFLLFTFRRMFSREYFQCRTLQKCIERTSGNVEVMTTIKAQWNIYECNTQIPWCLLCCEGGPQSFPELNTPFFYTHCRNVMWSS